MASHLETFGVIVGYQLRRAGRAVRVVPKWARGIIESIADVVLVLNDEV